MDFQSAMETFAEAWVAANTKNDQVQVKNLISPLQALYIYILYKI